MTLLHRKRYEMPTGTSLGELVCEHCGASTIHFIGVEVFARRDSEDSGAHTYAAMCDGVLREPEDQLIRTIVDGDMENNPSDYRDGVLIHYDCEQCGKLSTLALQQYKGNIFLEYPNTLVSKS